MKRKDLFRRTSLDLLVSCFGLGENVFDFPCCSPDPQNLRMPELRAVQMECGSPRDH